MPEISLHKLTNKQNKQIAQNKTLPKLRTTMKSRYPFTLAVTVGSSIGLVAAIGYTMATAPALDADATAVDSNIEHKLIVDHSPPERQGPLGGYADVVDEVSSSIVSIYSTKITEPVRTRGGFPPGMFRNPGRTSPFEGPSSRQEGLGSGVILTSDGIILTNNHVIDGASEVKVGLKDGGKSYTAEVVGRDPMTDLAILKIDAGDHDLVGATLGDSDLLLPGDTVLAIGNPFGLSKTVTSGIVSAIGRNNVGIVGYEDYIQTDASINPGNSGGALVDNKGRVIGINTAILSRTGGNVGIGFAIPINMAVNIADRLMTDGSVERGFLGVMLAPLTPELAKALEVTSSGALVNDVMSGTPAEAAGFKPGDVIVEINDRAVDSVAELRLLVSNTRPEESVQFAVLRDGESLELEAVIGRLPDNPESLAQGRSGSPEEATFIEGVEIESLTESKRQRLNVPREIDGVLITKVDPRSKAARAGLEAGEIITEVGRTAVKSVRDAVRAKNRWSQELLLLRVINGEGSRFVAVEMS